MARLPNAAKTHFNVKIVNTLHLLRVSKYNRNEFQNSQDLKKKTEIACLCLKFDLVML